MPGINCLIAKCQIISHTLIILESAIFQVVPKSLPRLLKHGTNYVSTTNAVNTKTVTYINVQMKEYLINVSFNSIQFTWSSKFTTYLPWGHPNMWTIQPFFIHIYKRTQANTIYTFIHKHIHKHLYNVYTNMYIHHTLSFMHKEEQYIVNNKHVE